MTHLFTIIKILSTFKAMAYSAHSTLWTILISFASRCFIVALNVTYMKEMKMKCYIISLSVCQHIFYYIMYRQESSYRPLHQQLIPKKCPSEQILKAATL